MKRKKEEVVTEEPIVLRGVVEDGELYMSRRDLYRYFTAFAERADELDVEEAAYTARTIRDVFMNVPLRIGSE